MEIDINLVLQIIVIVGGAIVAYMVRKGWIDRKTVDDTKDIANSLAAAGDKLKDLDPVAAEKFVEAVLEKIGDKKPVLDAFLKAMNHNKPHKPPEIEDPKP